MIYKKPGIGAELSIICMGGHEYLPDGRSQGFNEDFERAVRLGSTFEGFGQERRKEALALANERGINLFGVIQDSGKEPLGRGLQEILPPHEIYIQTHPEGMVYTYDPYNVKMARYKLLKAEVQRTLSLLRRERIDFFNFALMKSALDHDPEYLEKIGDNVGKLKEEGLIRFALKGKE